MAATGLHYSPMSYYSLGRAYPRERLRENPLPVRNRNWLDALFPTPPDSRISIVFVSGYWQTGYEYDAEWSYSLSSATSVQFLNNATNPVLVKQAMRIRMLPRNSETPSGTLKCYLGKRNISPPLLTTTPTIDGQNILVDITATQIYALIAAYGVGEMYGEIWQEDYPSPLATFIFFLDRSMAGGW